MKKVMFLMAVAGMFAFAACNNNKPAEAPAEEAAVEEVAVPEEETAVEEAVEATAEEVVEAAQEVVAE